jgi:hypothetical protein
MPTLDFFMYEEPTVSLCIRTSLFSLLGYSFPEGCHWHEYADAESSSKMSRTFDSLSTPSHVPDCHVLEIFRETYADGREIETVDHCTSSLVDRVRAVDQASQAQKRLRKGCSPQVYSNWMIHKVIRNSEVSASAADLQLLRAVQWPKYLSSDVHR